MKKRYCIPLVILIVLIITNPTFEDFEDHLPAKDNKPIRTQTHIENHIKLHNYFISSTYEDSGVRGSFTYNLCYLGILGNFFVIDRHEIIFCRIMPPPPATAKHDSAMQKHDNVRKKK